MERPGETLKKYLIEQPGKCPSLNPLSTLRVIQWTEQIVEALMVIHSMSEQCIHGDLRLQNVLVGNNFMKIMNIYDTSLRFL